MILFRYNLNIKYILYIYWTHFYDDEKYLFSKKFNDNTEFKYLTIKRMLKLSLKMPIPKINKRLAKSKMYL